MKIGFRARFKDSEKRTPIYNEERLSDSFLVFLPSRIEIIPIKDVEQHSYNSGRLYEIKMEVSKLITMEELKEKLLKMDISIKSISNIKREFTKEELEEVEKLVCFKEIFEPTEVVVK